MSAVWTSSITITPEMLRLIADIDAFRGRWKVLGTAAPSQLTSLRRAAIIDPHRGQRAVERRGQPAAQRAQAHFICRP